MKTWSSLLLLAALIGCGKKSEYSVNSINKEFCNCFNDHQAEKNIDKRLSPCVDKYINNRNDHILEYKNYEPAALGKALSEFSLDLFIELIHSCDSYYHEMNTLYNESYPKDTSDLNKKEFIRLSRKLETETNSDSVKSLLHKRAVNLISTGNFNDALKDISKIKTLDIKDEDAYLASAYIFNQMGMADKALAEIQKAIDLSKNSRYYIFNEITKRRIRETTSR